MANAVKQFIDVDRKCRNCSYNLKGLEVTGKCPECGLEIGRRKKGPRYHDQLVNAPLNWLRLYNVGALVLVLGFCVAVPCRGILPFLDQGVSDIAVLVLGVSSIVWWIGVLILTRPRPRMLTTQIDPRIEWFALRATTRVLQALWVVAAGLRFYIVQTNNSWNAGVGALPASDTWLLAARGLETGAAAGMVALLVYLSNIAFWASDSKLGAGQRAAAWLVGTCALHSLLTIVRDLTGWTTGAWILTASSMVIYPTTCVYLLYLLLSQASMSKWAMFNHAAAVDRSERTKERASRLAAEQRMLNKQQ